MSGTSILHVASSFNSMTLLEALQSEFERCGLSVSVKPLPIAELGANAETRPEKLDGSSGTLVVIRLEDWVRDSSQQLPVAGMDAAVRQLVRQKTDEFVANLASTANDNHALWFLLCPSTGSVAEELKLTTLLRTLGNLVVVRVRNSTSAAILTLPADVAGGLTWDIESDRSLHAPLKPTEAANLAQFVVNQVRGSFARSDDLTAGPTDGTAELATFLAGLRVAVRVTPAGEKDAAAIGKVLRSAAAFSLTGENPTMPDAEAVSIATSGHCYLIAVTDRLGDYGVAGILSARVEDGILVTDLMSLSCTVLGKQVEYAVAAAAIELARKSGAQTVAFDFNDGGRNQATQSFLETLIGAPSGSSYQVNATALEQRLKEAAVAPGAWSLYLE